MGYDSDNDNVCGLDMDYDGDLDITDDVLFFGGPADPYFYDDDMDDYSIYSSKELSSGYIESSNSTRRKDNRVKSGDSINAGPAVSIGTIILIIIGVVCAIEGGSIIGGIMGAFIVWLIVMYIKNFI